MKRALDYRVVIDTTPTLIFSARPGGYVDYVNRAFLEFFGTSFDDLEGSAWTKFVHPDDLEEHVRRWREATARGEPAVSEARSVRRAASTVGCSFTRNRCVMIAAM